MLLLFLPFIPILIAIISGNRIAKPLIQRNFYTWGSVIGAVPILGASVLTYGALVLYYRTSQKVSGYCYTCELTGLPFLAWFLGAVISFILYITLNSAAVNKAVYPSHDRAQRITYLIPILVFVAFYAFGWQAGIALESTAIGFLLFLVLHGCITYRTISHLPHRHPKYGWLILLTVVILGLICWQTQRQWQKYHQRQIVAIINHPEPSFLDQSYSQIGRLPQPFVSALAPFPHYVHTIQFNADGRWALFTYDDKLVLWCMSDLTVQDVFEFEHDRYQGAFSPDGSHLILLLNNRSLMSYDLETQTTQWQVNLENWASTVTVAQEGTELWLHHIGARHWDPNLNQYNYMPGQLTRVDRIDGQQLGVMKLSFDDIDVAENERLGMKSLSYGVWALNSSNTKLAVHTDGLIMVYAYPSGNVIAQLMLKSILHPAETVIEGQIAFVSETEIYFQMGSPFANSNPHCFVWDVVSDTVQLQPCSEDVRSFSEEPIIPPPAKDGEVVFGQLTTPTELPVTIDAFVNAAAYTPGRDLLLISTTDGYLRFFQKK